MSINKGRVTSLFLCRLISTKMAFQGSRYVVTYDDGNNANTSRLEVVAEDDTAAAQRVLHLFPNAQNIVVSSAG